MRSDEGQILVDRLCVAASLELAVLRAIRLVVQVVRLGRG
jgi:hypothetical protein